jgi:hypothetical protein
LGPTPPRKQKMVSPLLRPSRPQRLPRQIVQALQNNAAAFEKNCAPAAPLVVQLLGARLQRPRLQLALHRDEPSVFHQASHFTGHLPTLSAPLLNRRRTAPDRPSPMARPPIAGARCKTCANGHRPGAGLSTSQRRALLFRDPRPAPCSNSPPTYLLLDDSAGLSHSAPHAPDEAAYHPEDVTWFRADS